MARVRDVQTEFIKNCSDALKMTDEIENLVENHTISIKFVHGIYEYAFLSIFKSWEKFLEDSYIAFLKGSYTRNMRPEVLLKRLSDDKIYEILKGNAPYPDWTRVDNVIRLSSNFFGNPNPYSTHLRTAANSLTEISTIRNSIAHMSQKSRDKFLRLIRNKPIRYNPSISPGEFLRMEITGTDSTLSPYLNYYDSNLEAVARQIVPL